MEQPQSQSVSLGGKLVLSVQATGPGALSYQWLKDNQTIQGATAATLSITGVKASDAGAYTVSIRMQTPNGQQKRTSNQAVIRINE